MGQARKHQTFRHLLVGLAATLLIGMMVLVGCKATPADYPPPTQLLLVVPQQASLLARVELAEILNDEEFAELYQVIAAQDTDLPQTLDAALDKIEYDTSINLRDFTYLVVFAYASELLGSMEALQDNGDFPYCGVLVQGKLDERTFMQNIKRKIGRNLATSDYRGFTIYALTASPRQDHASSIAFFANGQMVIGTPRAVENVIDIMAGLQEPVSGTVCDLYRQLDDAYIKLVSSVPESVTMRIPSKMPVGPINLSLLSFRDIKYTTLTVTKNEAIINADAHLEFTNENSAKESGRLLWTAVIAGKHAVSDPDARELLSKIQTSRSGSSVSITLAMAMSEIERFTLTTLEEIR